MRIVALAIVLVWSGCARVTPAAERPDPASYERDCQTPPDSTGACVLRDQRG